MTNEAANEVEIVQAPMSIREQLEFVAQQLYADPYEYPGDEYTGETTGGDEPRLMLDIDSSGYLGATPEQEDWQGFYRVMIHNNRYIPQWKNQQDGVWNYFPDENELGEPRMCLSYAAACAFIRRFSHINVDTEIPLTSIIGRQELPDEKIYLYYR